MTVLRCLSFYLFFVVLFAFVFVFCFLFVKDGPETGGNNDCWPEALVILDSNLGVESDRMRERCSPVLMDGVYVYTGVHDDLVINGQSREGKKDIAIFSTYGIASGAL